MYPQPRWKLDWKATGVMGWCQSKMLQFSWIKNQAIVDESAVKRRDTPLEAAETAR